MGVSVIYSAIPPSSTLYARLQREKPLAILMASFFHYGDGIFHFFEFHFSEIEPEEMHETLEWLVEMHQDAFGSELEADRITAEFRAELRRTCQAYSGIENRTARLLGNSSRGIEERLTQELTRRQITNANAMVMKLIFGDQAVASTLLREEDSLGLISRELVHEGARILRQIEPESLFERNEDGEGWHLNDFERWRDLYLSADERNEAILVGVH